ncbi:hypothetical protein [Planomonospora sp. ID82291]|uniref:hypothetical protein n=1 Tax=Planomonospora sp. ID82291 TaxID=2738136 RepID=UPI0018C37872|nr:hypothetical protein [Planomonospora sp. ID82291]MBG0818715.1 hypothetical protein [Planomonospora sp. ID82291]
MSFAFPSPTRRRGAHSPATAGTHDLAPHSEEELEQWVAFLSAPDPEVPGHRQPYPAADVVVWSRR